jgi:hypothetical protein
LGFLMCFWIVGSVLTDLWERVRPEQGRAGGFARLRLVPRSVAGMMAAHLASIAYRRTR